MTVPWPLTMRVPRKPYTINASCGPAFRYSDARNDPSRATARIINPTITQNPTLID